MTTPRSNSRRFVNAAWSLLAFQLIASAGAVTVTGLAAFHVSNLVSPAEQASSPVVEAAEVEETPDASGGTETARDPVEGATDAPVEGVRDPAAEEASPDTASPPASDLPTQVAPAGPVNDGPGVLRLTRDQRGNINAEISDPDGVRQSRIQWLRNGRPVSGATGTTYTVTYNDSESRISARADYVDGDGYREVAVSESIEVGAFIQ